jgi:esterase/lipase
VEHGTIGIVRLSETVVAQRHAERQLGGFMKVWLLLITCLALAASNVEAQNAEPAPVSGVRFDANFFASGSYGKYGVIVLTGSNGGKADDTARLIANMGFDVLSLAYFDRAGSTLVPETLEMIPLEYFDAPKKWLMARNNTRDDGVIIYGLSKGAELALVLASHDIDYKAVVALAPSHVVWQGNPKNFADIMSSPSSWSLKGEPLPFVPYVSNEEKERMGFTNRHAASLTNREAVKRALIGVENINAPILLMSGGMDAMWPASKMGAEICLTVNSSRHNASCEHLIYEDGDHLLSNYQAESFAAVDRFLQSIHSTLPAEVNQ